MRKWLIFKLTFLSLIVMGVHSGETLAGEVQGKVLRALCPGWKSTEVRCPIEPVETIIDVVHVAVDGSVARRTVESNLHGRFRLSLSPGYYVLSARPPDLGMASMPVEFTVASSPVAVLLLITNPVYITNPEY